eukprot:Tbor_TRINITY_DN5817_c2_g1::TRINITY_DN5817_c2_g1_i2::g.6670::m.6670
MRATGRLFYVCRSNIMRSAAAGSSYRIKADRPAPLRRLSVVRPDLVSEWVPELNHVDVSTVSITSTEMATWRCVACGHQWETTVQERAVGEAACPECTRRATSGIASMSNETPFDRAYPDLVPFWDVKRNGTLRPADVHEMSTRAVWWHSQDGEEVFQRHVYAYLHDQQSPRERYQKLLDRRLDVLKSIAPLCAYSLPIAALEHAIREYKVTSLASNRVVSSNMGTISDEDRGSFSVDDIYGFENMWSAKRDQEIAEGNAKTNYTNGTKGELQFADDDNWAPIVGVKKDTEMELHLDASVGAEGHYGPAVPVMATLDFHAGCIIDIVNQCKHNGKEPSEMPSYILARQKLLDFFELPESEILKRKELEERISESKAHYSKIRRPSTRKESSTSSNDRQARKLPSTPSPVELVKASDASFEDHTDQLEALSDQKNSLFQVTVHPPWICIWCNPRHA